VQSRSRCWTWGGRYCILNLLSPSTTSILWRNVEPLCWTICRWVLILARQSSSRRMVDGRINNNENFPRGDASVVWICLHEYCWNFHILRNAHVHFYEDISLSEWQYYSEPIVATFRLQPHFGHTVIVHYPLDSTESSAPRSRHAIHVAKVTWPIRHTRPSQHGDAFHYIGFWFPTVRPRTQPSVTFLS